MTDDILIPVRGDDDLEGALREPLALLYKHSPLCGLSTSAARQVREFAAAHADVPVYIVDVIRDRAVSREVERRLEIRHESPQALVLQRGQVAWHASHMGITLDALEQARSAASPQ